MKLVFFGTPEYVVPVIDTLHKKFKSKTGKSPIEAVITQTPKPQGRKQAISYSPVDSWAYQKKIPKYFDPNELIKNNIHADLGILASYGEILSEDIIKRFPYGILNIHPSLLPSWRGSSPVQATIISEDPAGATIMKIEKGLDSGPVVSQFKDEVFLDDTTKTLRRRLFERSAEVLVTLIPAYLKGKITPRKQDDSKASFTREIKKSDGFIQPEYLDATLQGRTLQGAALKGKWKINFMKDFTIQPTPSTIHNFIRAMQPWPQAWSIIKIKDKELRLKILESHLETDTKNHSKKQNTNQKLVIDTVQLEGKNPVSWTQFKEGYPQVKLI